MAISRSDVLKIADLAKLHFSEEELDAFSLQFQRILDYIEQLKAVDITGVEPTSHVSTAEGSENCLFREDEVKESLSVDESLANAPDAGHGHFKVPKII